MNTSFFNRKPRLQLIILLVPILLYSNTLFNDYALDDSIVLSENVFVKQGLQGIDDILKNESFTGFFNQKKDLVAGGRYRPLSLITYAIEYQIWGLKPANSHAINVLLYSLLCLILFKVLISLLPLLSASIPAMRVAFFSTLVFTIHPVHTEVVANIKGRDEILAVLLLLLSFWCVIKYSEKKKTHQLIFSGIALFAALLAKENAILIWPVLFLVVLLKYKRNSIKNWIITGGMLAASTIIYLVIRSSVLGELSPQGSDELMNNPFLHTHANQKLPTIFYTLLIYLKLLVFPHPLTYDYYPYHIPLVTWKYGWSLLSVLLYLLLIYLLIKNRKENKILAFGIGFYLLTLLPMSNLFMNVGTFMNERFLFLPSIGFAIIAGFFISKLSFVKTGWQKVLGFLCIMVAVLFSGKTISRNQIWKNNFTLFTHDVQISENSAKGNCAAGGILYETGLKQEKSDNREILLKQSLDYLEKSLEIYPDYVDALLLAGNAHFALDKNMKEVTNAYYKLFRIAPNYQLAQENYGNMLRQVESADIRLTGFRKLLHLNPQNFTANYQLGITYGKMLNQPDSSQYYLKQAVAINPGHAGALRDLGVASAMLGDFETAVFAFKKVIALKPNDKANYINLGLTYRNMGRLKEAQEMFRIVEGME